MPKCERCKTSKSSLHKNGKNGDTIRYICCDCGTKDSKKYRNTEIGKHNIYKARDKYENTHPERKIAWNAARSIETKPCVICNKIPTHKHHPNIANKMEVVFLCPLHHRQVHINKIQLASI